MAAASSRRRGGSADYTWPGYVDALTTLLMPFTYSIAHGLAFGFISYVVLKAATGRFKEIHLATLMA